MSSPGDRPPEEHQQTPSGPYQGGYYPRYGPYPVKSANGTMILVLGILSIAICGLLGPVAWIMGNNSLREIDIGVADPNERGLVIAGRILGMIACALITIGCCIYAVFFGAMFSLGSLAPR